jgi:hypothetical protein
VLIISITSERPFHGVVLLVVVMCLVSNVARVSGLSFMIALSVFSDVYASVKLLF